ncbi:SARP family transcriptional regulator [Nocardiopsis terrae]|uniref:ATPase/DNA-binding SARP family transcriptional activator n=1 Tax=Nocardiopsis terrae TaxID=372655 RepID=A0ABR9HF50_9ACTN|nr:BTAD domain-containing putative transcriptional regulator [Nocardiopsis terrae]MBE1457660.1 putative ATPase/DNA-binding SARP family transcriptional activator [Nocardiopsis terrae]GHC84915.1 SARP family transcriptional regulator [Nocardiopsis terrae]
MRFSILGPLQVHDASGHPITIGGARLRALLILLLLRPGQQVANEQLTDAIWGEDVPAAAGNALQALASRLRRALGERTRLHGDASGYRLDVVSGQVDLHEFEDLARHGGDRLQAGRPREAERALSAAASLWRGPALPDLTARGVADDIALRLAETYRTVLEDHLCARIELGRFAQALPEAEALAAREPQRERPVELLMRALAGDGRTADALAAYEEFRKRLAEETGLDPSARLRETHLRLLRGELATAPAPGPRRAPDPVPPEVVRLPRHLTSFVPREAEVSAAVARLSCARVATLTGPGGSGKTRLAVETAATLVERTPELVSGGVWFVELAPVRQGDDLPDAIATALELRGHTVLQARTGTAPQPSLERVLAFLGERAGLVVLDNCEHLVADTARIVQTLLSRCPNLRVLATSREPLGVDGESLLPVPSLALPPEDADVEEARTYTSVVLFTERAGAVRPGFTVGPDNVAHVVRIMRELDGMPLALELAAARLRAMSPAQLAARLCDRFRLLTGGNRSALPRHRTLRAVVDWSWELLDEPERLLLGRLAVFPGGADLDAVERVGSDPEGPPGTVAGQDVWAVLFALVDKSLLIAETSEREDAPPRYRQLETVRAYAAERLTRSGEQDRVRDTQARYTRDLWRRADPELRGHDQGRWIDRLGREADNCAAAFHWALERRDAALALDLVEYSQWYWTLVGGWRQIHRWSEQALELVGDQPPAGREVAYASCLFHTSGETGLGRTTVLARIARVEEVLRSVGRRVEDHPLLILCLVYHAMSDGRPDSPARARLEEALDGQPDPWARAATYLMLSLLDAVFGQAARSLERASTALEAMRGLGDVWGQCHALIQLVDIARFTDLERCRRLLAEGVELARERGLEGMAAVFRTRRAQILVDLGDLEGAEQDLKQLAGTSAEGEHLVVLSQTRAQWLRAAGRTAQARRLMDRTEPTVAGLGGFAPAYIEPAWRLLAADLAWDEGDTDRAWREAGRAWWLSRHGLGTVSADVLDAFAGMVAEQDPEWAALLLGHATALRGVADSASPRGRRVRERLVERLGEDGLRQLLARGEGAGAEAARARVARWLAPTVPDDVDLGDWAR